jgi:hypothetical protein
MTMARSGLLVGVLAMAACGTASGAGAARVSQYTQLDDRFCGKENVIEETGDWDRRCRGAGGYQLEWSSGDLRENLTLMRGGKETNLDIPVKVAGGAFASLGRALEWRGPKSGAPDVLVARVHVANAQGKSDGGRLTVIRLGPAPCVVAVVAPQAGQSGKARAIADGKLPDCLAD